MITRDITEELVRSAAEYPVVTILGPRQSAKTTLTRMTFQDRGRTFLWKIRTSAWRPRPIRGDSSCRWKTAASWTMSNGFPFCISYIQGMVDKTRKRGRFILTGSHQPLLHEAISQSLAGRTAMLALWPFSLHEIRSYDSFRDPFELICRGFFPGSTKRAWNPAGFSTAICRRTSSGTSAP